jgi:hypothetical protein
MKRTLPISLLLAVAAGAVAQEPRFKHPFYPLKVGNQWTYRSGKELKEFVVIRVERELPLTVRKDKDGKDERVIGYEVSIRSGPRLTTEQVAVLADGVYRFGTADKAITPPLRFFKFPLKPGESWDVEARTEDGKTIKGTFVGGEELLHLTLNGKPRDVPATTVTCKDFRIDDQSMALTYWFAHDLGLVKQQVRTGTNEVTLELTEFRPAP